MINHSENRTIMIRLTLCTNMLLKIYLIQSSDIGICKTLTSSKAHDKMFMLVSYEISSTDFKNNVI